MRWRGRRSLVSVVVLALLGGCAGSDGDGIGTVSVSLTDAPSDALESFEVRIESVRLRRANGGLVTLLSEPVEADLLDLTDLGDLITVAELPAAFYVGGQLDIDWSSARARIAGKTQDAQVLSGDGSALAGTASIALDFPLNFLLIVAGRHRLLEFDFDLDSSLDVDDANNRVYVAPSIVLRVDPSSPRTLVTSGELRAVATGSLQFLTTLQRPNGEAVAFVTHSASASTVFHVDGEAYVGANGIRALASLDAGARVRSYGTAVSAGVVSATYVEAGRGTLGDADADVVQGLVTARTGGPGSDPVLTVVGRSLDTAGRSVRLNTSFTVSLSRLGTEVVRFGSLEASDTDDVNVGQRVRIFGELSGTTLDASEAGSVVRIQPTRIFGFATGPAVGGLLTIRLSRIQHRGVGQFDFDVSGIQQADPDALVVDVSRVSASGVTADTPVELQGLFPAVNVAGADFTATALTDRGQAFSWLRLRYLPAAETAVSDVTSQAIELDPAGAAIASIDRGFVGSTLLPDDPSPSIRAGSSGLGLFTVIGGGSVAIFLEFSQFASEIETRIAAGARVYAIRAIGLYSESGNSLTAATGIASLDR